MKSLYIFLCVCVIEKGIIKRNQANLKTENKSCIVFVVCNSFGTNVVLSWLQLPAFWKSHNHNAMWFLVPTHRHTEGSIPRSHNSFHRIFGRE